MQLRSETASVKLVAITKGVGDLDQMMSEEIISYIARVSNPSNQMNTKTAPKLLKYLAANKHWSPFEHVHMTLEIETSRAIAAQILRHRSFVFQEFCISGDSMITCFFKNKQGDLVPHYIPIKKLYERQSCGNNKDILIRTYDEKKQRFTTSKIKEVFFNGLKECIKINLKSGKSITCTKEHKFFDSKGVFRSFEDISGLKILKNKKCIINRETYLGTNGQLAHQDKNFLLKKKEEGILGTDRAELQQIKEVSIFPEKEQASLGIKKTSKNTLIPKFDEVMSVEYVGLVETYDLEVKHESHNYIANKIMVHNSQRYQQVTEFTYYKARRQDNKNRQNSIDDMNQEDKDWFYDAQTLVMLQARKLYQEALDRGVAKEQARFLLPLSTKTKLYMTGNARSWLHYIDLRSSNGTQKEHMEIALMAKDIFKKEFPSASESMGW